MSDLFTIDKESAVIRVYPSRIPTASTSAGLARRAVARELMTSCRTLADELERVTSTTWAVFDAEAQDDVRHERGRLIVNGADLGPAERDPVTGVVEAGPHISERATATIAIPPNLVDAIEKYLATDWRDGRDPSRLGALNAVAFIGEQMVALYRSNRKGGAP